MRNVNCLAESAMTNCSRQWPLQRKRRELTRLTVVEIKTILASSFPSGHSNIIIHMYKSNDIYNQLITSVNPEISCIQMGSGPALFGLARFYCIIILIIILHE